MKDVIKKIRKELKENADEKTKAGVKRFFKEPVKFYGVKSEIVKKIGKRNFEYIREAGKEAIFECCEELFESGFGEESFIGSNWTNFVSADYIESDIEVFEKWIESYIDNWAKCDTFCNHTVGKFLEMYPKYVSRLKKWAKKENRWMRRASSVSLIIPARKGMFLNEIFEIADILLEDKDDMVQKGYGWMLKEASRKHQKEVFEYVLRNKKKMPRTALRYAIELMPESMRKKAMKKD